MTNEELMKILKKLPKKSEIALAFVSKEKKVLVSAIVGIRERVVNDMKCIEIAHCEDQKTHNDIYSALNDIPIEGTIN